MNDEEISYKLRVASAGEKARGRAETRGARRGRDKDVKDVKDWEEGGIVLNILNILVNSYYCGEARGEEGRD